MKSDGLSSDDGQVFVCNSCNQDATTFLEIVGSLSVQSEVNEPD